MAVDRNVVSTLQLQMSDMLASEREQRRASGLRPLEGEAQRQHGRAMIERVVQQHEELVAQNGRQLPEFEHHELVRALEAQLFGAGALQYLLEDDSVENIDINGCDEVFVSYVGGGHEQVDPVASSDEELVQIVRDLATVVGLSSRPFDMANPQLDLRLPDGSRLSATMSVSSRPAVSIRRNTMVGSTLKELVRTGTMDDDLASFLRALVKAKMNVMIGGGTNAGKTTLLRAMVSEFDPIERIVTIERSLELGLKSLKDRHPNVVEYEERLSNAEGLGAVSMADLVLRSTRMNPSRVIVGEVLGDEVVTMLNAMSQGNDGSLSTIHARSADEVFTRIGTYAIQAREHLPIEATNRLVSGAVDFVVYVRKVANPQGGPQRIIDGIAEVVGTSDDGDVSRTLIWKSPDGRSPAQRTDVAILREWDLRAAANRGGMPL